MKYKYEAEIKDSMMDQYIIMKTSSDYRLTKKELIEKWHLDTPDISWYTIYDVSTGVRDIM